METFFNWFYLFVAISGRFAVFLADNNSFIQDRHWTFKNEMKLGQIYATEQLSKRYKL